MAAWLPLIKAALPYVTQIVTAAIPSFTSGKAGDAIPKQISELQNAVTHNAESIQGLAAQLKQTIEGIDDAGQGLQQELRGLRRLAGIAIAVAALAVCVSIWAVAQAGA